MFCSSSKLHGMEQQQNNASTSSSNSNRINGSMDDGKDVALQPKHKVFLSHSGFQKGFVEHLCGELEGCYRFPFFDKRRESLPVGEDFSRHIFDAIRQCDVGVVILSDEFITSKWPMMELVAMHERVLDEMEKGKSNFKVIPVFLRTSPKDLDDYDKCNEWFSCWQKLAKDNPKRVQIEKWGVALKYLRKLNGVVYERFGEVKLVKEIVDEICKVVPPEIKMEDSHIQGRSRICNIIQNTIDALRKDNIHGVCTLGLYGMGGIGKTSICKALCNDFFTKFRGKVCHAELERGSKEALLREVLKNLTNTSPERLNQFNEEQLQNALREGIIKDPIFLTLDNMSDQDASIVEVQSYLSARLPIGSIVIVTARSKDWLLRVRPYMDESKCMQMPEMMLEEAKSLFVKSSSAMLRNDVDDKLILRCVKRCYFQKEDDNKSCHYHPLALDVLGKQLSRLTDLGEWVMLLDRIDEDIFNQSRENNHPIFSILRKSFDGMSPGDQLLFMDVALYLPNNDVNFRQVDYSVFEWLGVVHNFQRVDDVIRALERLRAKSLLERVGDGVKERIGMHDLWRAFCVAETQGGEMGRRRWMYEAVNCSSELVEASPSGTCWENVKRMAFLPDDPRSLEKVDFGHFANVTVLKISMARRMAKKVVINLAGLIHLKSLQVWGNNLDNLVIQGLPRSLLFFVYWSESAGETIPSAQFMKQIARLEDLQWLCLSSYPGRRLPDMRSMVSLRVAMFYGCWNAVTLAGLSSKLTNLRVLYLQRCMQLRSCPGVGDLVALEELSCQGCKKLLRLPNLRKLRNLRKLVIRDCGLITELPGLEDLVALEELHASWWGKSRARLKLPDLRKLKNLRVLDLGGRRLQAAPGLDSLISLQKVDADFREVLVRPNLRQLTMLQELSINGCSLAELRATDDLAMLHTLDVEDCKGVDDLPDFQGPTNLRKLTLSNCEFKNATSLSELSTLEEIAIIGCRQLEVLPDLQGLTRLESLEISDCDMLRGWDFASGRGEESSCKRQDSNMQVDRREYQRLSGLRRLTLERCSNFADVTGIGAFRQLEILSIRSLPVLRELPDLSNFPHLNGLYFYNCGFLTRLTSLEPVRGLVRLYIENCNGVEAVPDLGMMFPALEVLNLYGCSGIVSLTSSEPLTRMRHLNVSYCRGVSEGDVDQVRALCPPQCSVHFKPYVEEVDSFEWMRVRRLFKGWFRG
ncbi:hypothetical protein KC19_2G280600 [Ceratodon purpureus]|uniref:TIR domain-containing protein n=1 Tax=Ceratodon purpureus TaxID=3225 RepID=A0A8T0IZ05_CERPU|nr:hypothetical protein KC19_2G280600 [Ceratodon purpureus]